MLNVLKFAVDGIRVAIELDKVRRVSKPGFITRLFRSPRHVLGLTTIEGNIVPVVDLHQILAGQRSGVLEYLVLTDCNGRPLALAAQKPIDVLQVDHNQISELQVEYPEQFILKVIEAEGQETLLLLDVNRIYEETCLRKAE